MDFKKMIIDEASGIGLDAIGFTSCSPFNEAGDVLRLREMKGYLSGFEETDIDKRITPNLLMENCTTIISAAVSYNIEKKREYKKEGVRHMGTVSKSSWGKDYHVVLKGKLDVLADFIRQKLKGKAMVYVDTGPLMDREIARRAGLGYVGRNNFLITPKYGSYVFLGEILTDIYIEPDAPLKVDCGDCDLCIKACPTGALCSPYTVNAKKCISYLTQCKDIPPQDYVSLGNNIYGCDICQNVCPKNKGISISTHGEFIPESWNSNPDAVDILEMDNKTFENTYKNTSSGWRGKKTLQRNAIITLGNSRKRENAQYIEKMLSDKRPDIRKVSVYALYNLLGKDSFSILNKHLLQEKDAEINSIIEKILSSE